MKYVFAIFVLGTILLGAYVVYDEFGGTSGRIAGIREETSESALTVTFLDVGQGDATYLLFGNGADMLVDCAIDARIIEALGRVMSWQDHTIDYLILTHPDFDHYGGCEEVLQRFEVKHILYTGVPKNDAAWKSFQGAITQEGAEYRDIERVEQVEIASTTLDFLYPVSSLKLHSAVPGFDKDTGANNTSIIMKVVHGTTSLLLIGDAEQELEEYLVHTYGSELDSDILKLGHHGSDSSSIPEFLSAVSPHDSIASAGKNNKYGHPSLRVLKRLERVSSTVWRTDIQGDITAFIGEDGYRVSVKNR